MVAKRDTSPSARWTPALASNGFTPVVKSFLEYACRRSGRKDGGLGLKPVQAMLIIQLIDHKRDARMPFPGLKTLAARLGITQNAVRNNLNSIVRMKLIIKNMRKGRPTAYDLTPLFARLEDLQAAGIERKARERAEAEKELMPESLRSVDSAPVGVGPLEPN